MTDLPLCGNCWSPTAVLHDVHGYQVCDDCNDLAGSPWWARAGEPHPFMHAPSSCAGWCFTCGSDRAAPVHVGDSVCTVVTDFGGAA